MTKDQGQPVNDETSQRSPVSLKRLGTEEYAALRDEILKRVELQYQLLNLALIVASTILTVSLSVDALTNHAGSGSQKLLLLLCPSLEMFLAIGWSDHNVQIAKAGAYIKAHYEEGWETYWPQNKGLSGRSKLAVQHVFAGGVPATGVFVITQVLTVIVAFIRFPETRSTMLGWYIVDGIVIVLTAWFIRASNIRADLVKVAQAKGEGQADGLGKGTEVTNGQAED